MTACYTPHLFISVGETGAFFTLRETYMHTSYVRGGGDLGCSVHNGVFQGSVINEVRSMHHFNLSQDLEEALAKAQVFADKAGMKLTSDTETLTREMREITRSTSEQMEARARVVQERQEAYEAEQAARTAALHATIAEGKFPVGPHAGEAFMNAPRDYLTWLARTDFEAGTLMRAISDAVIAVVPESRLLPVPHATLTIGKEKQRLTLDVVVVRCAHFDRPAFGSYSSVERVYITTMVDKATGACLVVKSPSFGGEAGEELSIKGTVKVHDNYKGQAQTVLQRIAVLGE
jgi:uncharacterized protein (DUF3820 family)